MRFSSFWLPAVMLALLVPLWGCSTPKDPFTNTALVTGSHGPRTYYKGENVPSIEGQVQSSTVLPDGQGNVVIIPGATPVEPNPSYTDARELKLKIRELMEQLVAGIEDCSLKGTVALPTAFVNLHNFEQTSDFGRLFAEQIYFELNQRGYAVRDYRIPGSIRVKKREGEYYLSRELGNVSAYGGNAVVVVGTYSSTPDAVFVNARLVRPSNGRVLRTANIVLQNNPTIARMLRVRGPVHSLTAGNMIIRDFDKVTNPPPPPKLTDIDKGADIH